MSGTVEAAPPLAQCVLQSCRGGQRGLQQRPREEPVRTYRALLGDPVICDIGQHRLLRRRGLRDDLVVAGETKASWVADNYNHLHEAPTVFYAVCLVLAMIGQGDNLNATIAWAYVGLRIAHSLLQVISNRVLIRFALFALSSIALMMLVTHAAISVLLH